MEIYGMLAQLLSILTLVPHHDGSPILLPNTVDPSRFAIPPDSCYLPPIYGYESFSRFLEDCDSLAQFPTVPMPVDLTQKAGTHPMVCCPHKINEDDLCFPSDPWCPTYVKPDYGDIIGDEPDYELVEPPTLQDEVCPGTDLGNGLTLDTCVPLLQCEGLISLAPTNAPAQVLLPCGFDTSVSLLKVCCPDTFINRTAPLVSQPPRFPAIEGGARECQDKHQLCGHWKNNGACDLDRTYYIAGDDPNGEIDSKRMFDFTNSACLSTCDRCGDKGCVDEHPLCVSWAKAGMCIVNPLVMAHTCRESCGVCGFLSPDNTEEQRLGGDSYTDFTSSDFDCGRFKLLTEVNPEGFGETEETETEEESTASDFDLRIDESDDFFFSSQGLPPLNEGDKPDVFCGATVVSDRWVVAAAHCYDELGSGVSSGPRQVRVNNIRQNTINREVIDIKRVYVHPLYKYPNLYNDIAVLELGRRIEYNWDVFGDTPSCIDRGIEKIGKISTIQGFGLDEKGHRNNLLETNVTIISTDECERILESNLTNNPLALSQKEKALPQGLSYGLLCAQGEFIPEKGIFKGSCRGDSGGPLTTLDTRGRTTLTGIVSGGISCGKGYPGWYTKVEFFKDWIECIIRNGRDGNKGKKEILVREREEGRGRE